MKSTFGCFLVTFLLAFYPSINEAASLKTALHVRGSRSQWENLNAAAASNPTSLVSLRTSHTLGKKQISQSKSDDDDVNDEDGKDHKESADEVEKAASDEESKDEAEIEAEGNETKQKKEEHAAKEKGTVATEPEAEIYTTTPQTEPFSYMYDEADAVARDVELRRGVAFHPQGTKPDLDMTKREQFKTDTFFSQDPSIFGHCILIRDFAEPLRVGSALMRTRTNLRKPKHHGPAPKRWHANSSKAVFSPPDKFVRAFAGQGSQKKHVDGDHDSKKEEDDGKLPDDVLIPKGGVIDKDVGEEEEKDGSIDDDAELEVSMFAYLRSVAGEVAVIPNGDVAKWSSKKKVPLAGYLCTTDEGPVLHTLPTPCLPTSIDENGQAFAPPHPPVDQPPTAPPGVVSPAATEEASDAPEIPVATQALPEAPASAPQTVTGLPTTNNFMASADPDAALEAQAEAEAEAAEAIANGPGKASLLQSSSRRMHQHHRRAGPAPAPAQAPAGAPVPAQPVYEPFHVWVGSSRLEFKSKPKAERFCKRLAKRIAEDPGDAEWDTDRIIPDTVNKQDMTVANFMRIARKASPDWTRGTKSLLVVVMDWMPGDSSRAPYSEQTKTPAHYKNKIFPRVREAFQRMSYGQFDLDVTVLPEIVKFTKPRSRYTAGGYPFPGIYNGAKESLEGTYSLANRYSFDNYDLVYVISPQQAPTGTKGVAWVGAKGAMCNGCEAISENFQVMVAVHELGHNLGLWHASSKSLEYGNVFDWMGNYPDVVGLSYGLGYKLRLNWLPQASISKITDSDVASLNDEYYLMPFDGTAPPVQGQLTGIQIHLKGNRRDIYVSYRKEPGEGKNGVFLTWQDRDKPNSELIDCACHSPSQQDAALREGWTYMDPSGSVVIHAHKIEGNLATIRIYKAPGASAVGAIRARSGFTDGAWKCPKVCTDADLLVSLYKGCGMLAQDGYCNGGSITMSGKKFSIGSDLCPKSCDQCATATSGGSLTDTGCDDRNVKISGMTCRQAASKGYCDYSTNIGHIGDDLCPKSCGRCPARPAASSSSSSSSYEDPTPARTHGLKSAGEQTTPMSTESTEERNEEAAKKEEEEESAADKQDAEDEKKEEEGSSASETCTDDPVWTDADGDGCKVYSDYVSSGKLTQDEACNYGTGESQIYCRRTCNTCKAAALQDTCEDKQCVTRWRIQRGKCYSCSEWKSSCDQDFFAHDCPRTCGLCKADAPDTTPPLPTTPLPPTTTVAVTMPPTEPATTPPPCEDHDCVDSWLKSFGVCHKCADFAEDYCGRDELFMQSCPKSCRICVDGEVSCHDDFLPHTCKRYTEWGWCGTHHIAEHCKASCGLCQASASHEPPQIEPTLFPGGAHRSTSLPVLTSLIASLVCLVAALRL